VPNTATLQYASPYRLVFELAGDGTVLGPTLDSAGLIAGCVDGPLKDALSASYASLAAMKAAFMYGNPCEMRLTLNVAVNDVTAQHNQVSINVAADLITATRPSILIEMSDTTGQFATLVIEYSHSIIR
jgi:hypothetical protein